MKPIAALALLTLLAACGGGDNEIALASLFFFHAAPDAPAFDVWVEGGDTPLVTNLRFGESTGDIEVNGGDIVFALRTAGAPASAMPVYTSVGTGVSGERHYRVTIQGLMNPANADEALRITTFRDQFLPVSAGEVSVRLIHTLSDQGPIDLDIGADGSVEITNVARFGASDEAGFSVPANQMTRVALRDSMTAAILGTFTLPALVGGTETEVRGQSIFAFGTTGGRPADGNGLLLGLGDHEQGALRRVQADPTLQILHASPDAPELSLTTTGGALIPNIEFGELTTVVTLAPGVHPLTITPAAGGPALATAMTANLSPGSRYLVSVEGFVNPPSANERSLGLVTSADSIVRSTTDQTVRVLNLSPENTTIDFSFHDGAGLMAPLLVDDLAAGIISLPGRGLSLPTVMTPLALGVRFEGGGMTRRFDVGVAAGLPAFFVVAGSETPQAGQAGTQLLVVEVSQSQWTAASVPVTP